MSVEGEEVVGTPDFFSEVPPAPALAPRRSVLDAVEVGGVMLVLVIEAGACASFVNRTCLLLPLSLPPALALAVVVEDRTEEAGGAFFLEDLLLAPERMPATGTAGAGAVVVGGTTSGASTNLLLEVLVVGLVVFLADTPAPVDAVFTEATELLLPLPVLPPLLELLPPLLFSLPSTGFRNSESISLE